MNERIKLIRKNFDMSQEKFGKTIGVSRDTIANIESDRIEIKDIFITSICREFNINENWLRTGNGEMFNPISKNEEIADMISDVIKSDEKDFKRRLISALARLDDTGWENLEKLIDMISGNN